VTNPRCNEVTRLWGLNLTSLDVERDLSVTDVFVDSENCVHE